MAEKRRFLDVWLVEANTVYREVPFTAVIDWIQQGRLLEADMLRWSGQKDWFLLSSVPAFVAYLPRSEGLHADDQAEALESVQLDFRWRHRPSDDDDDVDMIPLIDVTLVLLIFFMMLPVSGAAAFIMTPSAQHFMANKDPKMYWVGMDRDRKSGDVEYTLGVGGVRLGRKFTSQVDLVAELRQRLQQSQQPKVEVNIKAHQDLPEGLIQDLLVSMDADEVIRSRVTTRYTGVR